MKPSHGTPTRCRGEALDLRAERLDAADDLMPEDERQLRLGQLAVDDVEIGAAHAARRDLSRAAAVRAPAGAARRL